jgi:hypothetical protein
MNFSKSLASLALAAVSLLGNSAQASTMAAHEVLFNTVESTGVSINVNPSICWEDDAYGWYHSSSQTLVICQEQKTTVNVQTNWTEEDLDTLRHEAHHMVQDCRIGSTTDGKLVPVYEYPVTLAKEVMGEQSIPEIAAAYPQLSKEGVILELEAFAVAAMNDPIEQVQDIRNYCF